MRYTSEELLALSNLELEKLFEWHEKQELSDRHKVAFSYFPQMEKNLKRKGNTKYKEWLEYKKLHPDGFASSQFNELYNKFIQRSKPVMHINHKAGDKMQVDYAGEKLKITDKLTGEIKDVEVFVAILGASQLTYVEATETQQKEDFISSNENALHYFEGVPQAIVPDNLKSAVTKSDKFEPTINETFADFGDHYGTSILPARAYRPKDKALAEGAVKIVYSRMYTALRSEVFFTLEALNKAIWTLLEAYNNVLLTGRTYSRREQFEEIERSALQPLPELRYEFKRQAIVTVMKIGHVCLREDDHYYSVPYKYIGKKVKILYTKKQVDIYYRYECIAQHEREKGRHHYTTVKEHLASTHQFMNDWNPDRFKRWAASIDKSVEYVIDQIFEKKQHPEQAYKSCLGILNMDKKVGRERLINACKRAIDYNLYNYKSIQMILEKGLDGQPQETNDAPELPLHDNIRGEEYYQQD